MTSLTRFEIYCTHFNNMNSQKKEVCPLVEICASVCPKNYKLSNLPIELREVLSKYMNKSEQIEIFSEYKRWYEKWQLAVQANYENGKLEGEYRVWHPNGKLEKHCHYKGGELEGEYKGWHTNGELAEHCYYKEGKKDGEYNGWYTNGELAEHCHYKGGELEGEYRI